MTVLWILFIFSRSLQPAEQSSAESAGVWELFNRWYHALGFQGEISVFLIRKLAHFTEFFLLGTSLYWTTWAYVPQVGGHITKPLLACVLVPLCDETIQLFSPGRSSEVRDVWIDVAGAVTGLLLFWGIVSLQKHRKRKKDGEGATEQ